ncbi:MAG: hypothetical protein U0935_11435 [Pirellulales bacterium]
MLSQTAEYAFTGHGSPPAMRDTLATTVEIAESTKVPAGYLSKVMQALARADLAISQRGLGADSASPGPPIRSMPWR